MLPFKLVIAASFYNTYLFTLWKSYHTWKSMSRVFWKFIWIKK